MKFRHVNQHQNQQQNQLNTKQKYKLKLKQKFTNEIVADEKDISDENLLNYFKYQNPSFLAKDLIRTKRAKNEQ